MLSLYSKTYLGSTFAARYLFTNVAKFSTSHIAFDSPVMTNDSKLLKALKLAEEEKEKQKTANSSSCTKNNHAAEAVKTTTNSKTVIPKDKINSLKIGSKMEKSNKIMDYSWLPKAPKLKSAGARNVRLEALYSGYRPLFLEYKKVNDASVHKPLDGRFLLEALEDEEVSIWSYSATEAEYFPEWSNVPVQVANSLKPFDKNFVNQPKKSGGNKGSKIKADNDKQEKNIVLNEDSNNTAAIISKGRKRYLPGKYIQDVKLRQARKLELQRLLSKKNKNTTS